MKNFFWIILIVSLAVFMSSCKTTNQCKKFKQKQRRQKHKRRAELIIEQNKNIEAYYIA